MNDPTKPGSDGNDDREEKLPPIWSADGHTWVPTTWKALLVVAVGAIAVGMLIAWLS
ncbi:hypothetical protein [Leucobacter sp. L43]|uniref:hypothetical protein n=1 Tax=Leucobacter sp. L43 TaxID=2798040 RepID=UPI0019084F90|nr:hypothetical protein [Leucobacter sp. L43]